MVSGPIPGSLALTLRRSNYFAYRFVGAASSEGHLANCYVDVFFAKKLVMLPFLATTDCGCAAVATCPVAGVDDNLGFLLLEEAGLKKDCRVGVLLFLTTVLDAGGLEGVLVPVVLLANMD